MKLISQEDSMVNITTFSFNWKQMGNGFFDILESILKRYLHFWKDWTPLDQEMV